MNEDKATRYHRLIRRATALWILVGFAALVMFLRSGGSSVVRSVVTSWTAGGPSAPSTVALYALALVIGYHAYRLPLALYLGFVLERRYGLSTGRFRTWFRDYLKSAALLVLLAVAASEAVYATMRWSPRWWWVASAVIFSATLAVLARLAPVALLPLFYRFQPLERESLRTRLTALSDRAGIPVLGAYVWGLGEKSRRANAALVGTGATRRILLSDTLLSNYSDDEIEVILAHEMGHHVHGDIRRGLVLECVVIAASFGVSAAVLDRLWPALRLSGPDDVAGLPLLFLAGTMVSIAAVPLLNALSRRNERRADRYALGLASRPDAFVSAMRRLGAHNLAEERPSRVTRWLFHTHPTIEERIEAIAKIANISKIAKIDK